MIKVLFICHGNICRSPMSEFVLKDMVEQRGLTEQFEIASAATSTEEIWKSNLSAGAGRTKKAWDWKDCIHQLCGQARQTGDKRRLSSL